MSDTTNKDSTDELVSIELKKLREYIYYIYDMLMTWPDFDPDEQVGFSIDSKFSETNQAILALITRKQVEARIAENNMYIKELTRHHFPAGLKVPHIPLVQFYERIDELTTVLMRRTPKERNNE